MTSKRICLGVFAGAHGVKGEAKVKTFTESEDGIARYGAVSSEDGSRRFHLKFIRTLKPGLAVVSAPEIRTREDAAAATGGRLYIERSKLPAAAEGEFYIEDLIGLEASVETGAPLGRVAAVHNFGAGDVIELSGAPGRTGALMIPFTRAAVPGIDLAKGQITVSAAALSEITAEAAPQEEAD